MKKILLCLMLFHAVPALAIHEHWMRDCLEYLIPTTEPIARKVLFGDEQQGMYLLPEEYSLNAPRHIYRPTQTYQGFSVGEEVWVRVGDEESKEVILDLTEDGYVKIFSSYLPIDLLNLRKISP